MSMFDESQVDGAVRTVRPYILTGGRTRTRHPALPIEALVRAVKTPGDVSAMTAECRRIVELTRAQILSVAELTAYLHLPLGVVRVLVGDLADQGAVVVHGSGATPAGAATDLKVLESVRHGIAVL